MLSCVPCTRVVCMSTLAKRELPGLCSVVSVIVRGRALHVTAKILGRVVARTITVRRPPSSGNGELGLCCVARITIGPPAFIVFMGSGRLVRFSCAECLRGGVQRTFNFEKASLGFFVHREGRGSR